MNFLSPPAELKRKEPLAWSSGTGADVWSLFCACVEGDLEAVKRLVAGGSVARPLSLQLP